MVDINLREDFLKCLLVPDSVRRSENMTYQKYLSSEIQVLATNSDLGKVLLGQKVGLVRSSDHRFQDLQIIGTQIASNDILRFLNGIYPSTQKSPTYKLQERSSGGGSTQRWQDGARSDAYVICNRCETLYFIGSTCEC